MRWAITLHNGGLELLLNFRVSSGETSYRIPLAWQLVSTRMAKLLTVCLTLTHIWPRIDATDLGILNLGFSWVEIGSVTPKSQVGLSISAVAHRSLINILAW
jgi:hypothetical protein